MKVLSTGVSLAVVDGLGRRKALLGGITLMALSVLSLSVFAFYQVIEMKRCFCQFFRPGDRGINHVTRERVLCGPKTSVKI